MKFCRKKNVGWRLGKGMEKKKNKKQKNYFNFYEMMRLKFKNE